MAGQQLVPSLVAPGYAPEGLTLVSVSVLGRNRHSDEALDNAIRGQVQRWFGSAVTAWRRLAVYHIAHAQPEFAPPGFPLVELPPRLAPGLYACGDYRDNPSIQGALASGRRAADAVVEDAA